MTIKLCYASSANLKINIQSNLMIVLNKRFSYKTGILNLENFARDAGKLVLNVEGGYFFIELCSVYCFINLLFH